MDIDILFTTNGEAGIISDKNLVKKLAGVLFDPQSGLISMEYVDMDQIELNIPLDREYLPLLDSVNRLHFGAINKGEIAQAYQIPLLFVDDPYRSEADLQIDQYPRPLQAFEHFVRRCTKGQPVHREDLGDEHKMGCILGEAAPASLTFAPHLARRHAMETAPRHAPSAPGPSGPGLGSGSAAGGGSGSSAFRRPSDDESS